MMGLARFCISQFRMRPSPYIDCTKFPRSESLRWYCISIEPMVLAFNSTARYTADTVSEACGLLTRTTFSPYEPVFSVG